jgi:hypothetical protein
LLTRPLPPDNSESVRGASRCHHCRKAELDTKEAVSNGLRLIRVRYGLPFAELPDLHVPRLSCFLSFLLLVGQERPMVVFPRRQGSRDEEGMCDLVRMSKRQRWEFALSCASIKRNLPSGCGLHSPSLAAQWERTASSSPPPYPPTTSILLLARWHR